MVAAILTTVRHFNFIVFKCIFFPFAPHSHVTHSHSITRTYIYVYSGFPEKMDAIYKLIAEGFENSKEEKNCNDGEREKKNW